MTYIDPKSIRRVTVVRRSQSQDNSGDYGAVTETTLHSGIIVDIQPAGGKLTSSASGFRPETTHLMFTREYFADIAAMDVVKDGAQEYEVLVPADWREHSEYQLRAL